MVKNKKTNLILILASSALLVAGMTACGPRVESSSTTEPTSYVSEESIPSSESKVVSKISKEALPKIAVGQELDLDDYITIIYADKTEDKEYQIESSDADLQIVGHKVVASAVKTFTVSVKAGNKTSRVTIDVRSEANIEIAEFLAPLAITPQNYTLHLYDIGDAGLEYDGASYIHNENYIAIFDAVNFPGEDTTILEKLADGNAYWGEFDSEGKPVFEAGKASYDDYYITGDLAIDGYDFTSTFVEEEGEVVESLSAPATSANALLNYGLSQFPEKYNYSVTSLDYLGGADYDADGKIDEILVMPMVSDGTNAGYWCIVGITAIGSTAVAALEEAHVDPAYVPQTMDAPELTAVFEADEAAASKTVAIRLYASDERGNALENPTSADTAFVALFGAQNIVSIATYDENGLDACLTIDGANAGNVALFNYEGAGYQVDFSGETPAAVALEGIADVRELDYVKAWMPTVTADDVNNTEWTAKQPVTGEGYTGYAWAGQVGDNDGTERGNMLFESLFNNFRWFSFSGNALGTYLTMAQKFSSGTYHALSLYSTYDSVLAIDNGVISVSCTVYLPFGLTNNYCTFIYQITGVGVTVNDFSAYYPVTVAE